MFLSRHATRSLAVALALIVQPGCQPPDPEPEPPGPFIHLDSGLQKEELQKLYHDPEGSELLPLGVLRALHTLDGKPFLSAPERFGLLKDPDNRELPVGMSKHRFKNVAFEWVGFNCAACHVNEFTYQGTTVRVDGAPGLLNLGKFYSELSDSLGNTLSHPLELARFIYRFAEQRSPRRDGESEASLLRRVYAAEPLPEDDAQLQAYVADQVSRFAQQALQGKPQLAKTTRFRLKSEEDVNTLSKTVEFLMERREYLKSLKKVYSPTAAGPGRLDAFGGTRALLFDLNHALTAPVSYPFLWGTGEKIWSHYDANTNTRLQRNMGQALSLGATFDPTTHTSTLLPKDLHELSQLTRKLKSPSWPDLLGLIDEARKDAGRQLFVEHCERCHGGNVPGGGLYSPQELGTDEERLKSFDAEIDGVPFAQKFGDLLQKLEDKALEDPEISDDERRSMEVESPVWRSTYRYAARPLNGIWATAPYLHNGSVPTLWDLLQPAAKRPTRFSVGQREYDPAKLGYAPPEDDKDPCATQASTCEAPASNGPRQCFDVQCKGNSNAGHEYGTHLTDEEKHQLLEYLKTL